MFRKQFKVKSNTHVKGSERKKIRNEIGRHFPQLTNDDLNNLFPSKEVMATMKITTHSGESVIVYSVDKIPMVFEFDKVVYPTVYMLWKYPNLVYTFTTHPIVYSKLVSGADLMLPGIVMEEPYTIKSFGKLKKGDMVAVNLTDNSAPIAIGTAALSSLDMYMSAKRGKGVYILHYNGDFLCANQKSCPPSLGPPPIPRTRVVEEESDFHSSEPSTYSEDEVKVCESSPESEYISSNSNDSCQEGGSLNEESSTCDETDVEVDTWVEGLSLEKSDPMQEQLGLGAQEKENNLQQDEEVIGDSGVIELCTEDHVELDDNCSCLSPQESMDKLIEYCFLKALKTTAKKLSLPLLASNLFKVHMIPACPKGELIDVKKSSYKKLSKFLKEMEANKVIELKELTKGVESISNVNYCHPMLKLFVEDSDGVDCPLLESSSANNGEVNEMYVINAATLPIFRTFGYRKGESVMATTIRQHLTEYVMRNGLQNPDDKRFVKLDHTLSSCLRLKEDEVVTWKELMTTCIERMGNSYSIGQSGLINKGKLKPIEITVATRSGNKKVTIISNLDSYGINCSEFAKKCQHGVAASATITQLPGSKSSQVMVQGIQIIFLEKLLTVDYQINKRYIRGLENVAKLKKQKQQSNKQH